MNSPRALLAVTLLALACAPSGSSTDSTSAAAAAPAPSATVVPDLMRDVDDLQKKMIDLAKAIPAAQYGYRPGAGVRSVGEVVMHVASDNYFIPAAAGSGAAPEATGIKSDNYETVVAYEKRQVSPDSAVKELEASFAFLKQAMTAATPASLGEKKNLFGSEMTGQQLWIMTTTHLHEHLGQMIAYARANKVVPPWSQ